MTYQELSREELLKIKASLEEEYEEFKARGLKLDMSRGKPGAEQLDLSMDILDPVYIADARAKDGVDCRNYGVPLGIAECRELFGELLGVPAKNVIICGNSSLNIMYDYIAQCMISGSGDAPWASQGKIKFICPAPGYDRHFKVLESFGIEMLTVPMLDDGPDMDLIDELVKDPSVKGLFCVPKYSNPEGKVFSPETVRRMAGLKPAAKDFRVIWDNAYIVHDLYDDSPELANIFDACREYGSEDMFIEVASTSKITFPGAGVSVIAASDKNIEMIKKRMGVQIICHDKLNQLRHVNYFKNADGIKAHMKRHAAILRPKFEAVLQKFDSEFSGRGIARWTTPKGGYFISLDVMEGCAKRVVALCKDAGVALTGAGAAFPYGKDPKDSNIRIAPTYPSVEELSLALELLCICVKLAAAEKLTAQK